MTGNKPLWWQRCFPRWGNWGGPGWSGGVWNNDPEQTDWDIPGVDAMDELFKAHDFVYQTVKRNRPLELLENLNTIDASLVRRLKGIRPDTMYGRIYRLLAMLAYTIWPHIRRAIGERGWI